MTLNIQSGITSVEAMKMQLNKGISAQTFTKKVETVLRDGKITAQEFKELAKDVVGGEATLMKALQKISPKFDKKFIESTDLPTDRTTSKQIKKDDLLRILSHVTDGAPVTKTKNRSEMRSIRDEINLLKAEDGQGNIDKKSTAGKLLGALEIIHGSTVEATKGGLEGKDKLASQTKDIIGLGKSTVPTEAVDLTSAFSIAKNTASMGSCVVTFASTVMAIKEAVEDGATIKDLTAVKNELTAKLNGNPRPSVEERAEIKSKIAGLNKVIDLAGTSMGGNITEAIGQAISTAGGLMEFSAAVAPHLANSVELAGNGISAFSGIVTGVATTIKESVRLDDNRKLKSRAKEFVQNPAKAMLKDKEKEAKIMTESLEIHQSGKKDAVSEKAGLEKKLIEAKRSPDSPARTTKIAELEQGIGTLKTKIGKIDTEIVKLQDKIDEYKRDPKTNTNFKAELEKQVKSLKDEKTTLTAKQPTLTTQKNTLTTEKNTLTDKKVALDTEKATLSTKKTELSTKKTELETEKNKLKDDLKAAKELPKDDLTKSGKIAALEAKIGLNSNKIAANDTAISTNNSKISTNEKAISTNNSAIEKNKKELDVTTKDLAHVETRIAEITTEIGDAGSGLTKKIADTQGKIDTTLTRNPEIAKLVDVSKKYEDKNISPADKKDLRESIGISTTLDDIGTQVVKRRSIGHSIFGVVKGLLATAGGIAATVGAIAGTVLLAATPVGWALAGAAAVIGIGMLGYKVYKTVQRNKTEANLKNQAKELSDMKTTLEGKTSTPEIEAKIQEVKKLQSRVESMQLKKSPKAAVANIMKVLTTPVTLSTPPTDSEKNKLSEQNAMKKFVQHVFKLDPDALAPTPKPPATSLSSEQIKMQEGMEKILKKKMPMFA